MATNLKKKPVAGLPSGVGIGKIVIKEVPYWRVRLGKRFTGGDVQIKHFSDLADAREWIFGDDANSKKSPLALPKLGVLNLKRNLGTGAFTLIRPATVPGVKLPSSPLPPVPSPAT